MTNNLKTISNKTMQSEIGRVLKEVLGNDEVFEKFLSSRSFSSKALNLRRVQGGKFDAHFAIELPFHAAKLLGMRPMEVGEKLCGLLENYSYSLNATNENMKIFASVQSVKPGFVNVKLSPQYASIMLAMQHENELDFAHMKGKRIHLEYVSANPTGPLHVGHGRWAAVGSALAALLRQCGADVHCEFYVNDGGLQIQLLNESVKALQSGVAIPENGYRGAYLEHFKNASNPSHAILTEQKEHLKNIRADFQNFFFESTLTEKAGEQGNVGEVLSKLEEKGLAYWKDDALWFASTKGGDDKDRVLIKSNGDKTYFAMDVAYHFTKITRGYTHLIDILGADHHGYVSRISTASKLMNAAHQKSTNSLNDGNFAITVLVGQLVALFRHGNEVRMSKRTGDMVTMQEVVDEIGVDAFRYFLLAQSLNKRIDFDLNLAKQKSMDNPVYYLQYAHARSQSLINKALEVKLKPCLSKDFNIDLIAGKEVNELVNILLFYRSELLQMAKSLAVHHLPHFLKEMAAAFHALYNAHAFIRVGNESEYKESEQYLFLVQTFQRTIANGLGILGISAPMRM